MSKFARGRTSSVLISALREWSALEDVMLHKSIRFFGVAVVLCAGCAHKTYRELSFNLFNCSVGFYWGTVIDGSRPDRSEMYYTFTTPRDFSGLISPGNNMTDSRVTRCLLFSMPILDFLQSPDSNGDETPSNRSKLVASRVTNCWLFNCVLNPSSSLWAMPRPAC